MIDSDQRLDSNQHPLTSLSQITVRFKDILKSASFQILRSMAISWLGLRIGQTLVMSLAVDLRIECRFENLKKRHRYEVQMSVT